jgi:hypothetical protein
MKTESVLPVHRPERQLAFNSKVDRAGSSNRFPLRESLDFPEISPKKKVGSWSRERQRSRRLCIQVMAGLHHDPRGFALRHLQAR